MKKIYLSVLMLAVAVGANAQQNSTMLVQKHDNNPHVSTGKPLPKPVAIEKATVIWSDDFSTPANWTMNNTSAPTPYDWVITTNQGDIPNAAPELQPFNSTSNANGFALINSDGQPGNADGDGAIVAGIRTAAPIDITGQTNLVIRYQHSYRWWHEIRGMRVSFDGTTWFDYDVTSDTGGTFPNGYPNNQNSENPVQEAINISSNIPLGATQMWIEFYYNDNDFWAWYWVVDDVEVIVQPDNDLQIWSAFVSGANNGGIEYGRTPSNHVDASWNVGAQVYNFGVLDQATLTLDSDFTAFTSQGTLATLASGDTAIIESTETPTLSVGVYTGDYTLQSLGEQTGSPEFGDNTYQRVFEITNNVYSLDGQGNHPAAHEDYDRIGTASFNNAADALVLAGLYMVKNADQVSGLRVLLDPATVAGGSIYGSLKDTATFYQNDMSSLFQSAEVVIAQSDIDQGYVDILFDGPQALNAGAYYAAVELYSNANANNIVVVDDQTVPQPNAASMIYIQGDQIYTNGTGIGIRMLMGDGWGAGLDENTLAGVSVYPNPSNGVITVGNDNNIEGEVTVQDIAGRVVFSGDLNGNTTIDLSGNGTGVYVVKVASATGNHVERIVIK